MLTPLHKSAVFVCRQLQVLRTFVLLLEFVNEQDRVQKLRTVQFLS